MTAIVDFHVHLYRSYSLVEAVDALCRNTVKRYPELKHTMTPHVLCLTEREGQHWFKELSSGSAGACDLLPVGWKYSITEDGLAIRLDLSPAPVYLVAGRQIITEERLELLSLTCDLDIADGIPVAKGIEAVKQAGGIPVIPWSPGKWMGKRGRILHALMDAHSGFYLGDTAIRPGTRWGGIHFAKAATQNMLTLPGSDPLPAKGETAMFGKLSAIVDISCCNPATELRDWVRKQTDLIYPPSGLGVSGMLRRMVNLKLSKTPM